MLVRLKFSAKSLNCYRISYWYTCSQPLFYLQCATHILNYTWFQILRNVSKKTASRGSDKPYQPSYNWLKQLEFFSLNVCIVYFCYKCIDFKFFSVSHSKIWLLKSCLKTKHTCIWNQWGRIFFNQWITTYSGIVLRWRAVNLCCPHWPWSTKSNWNTSLHPEILI